MARKHLTGERDGIEIEYDAVDQRLYLFCEPDAFARFQNIARESVRDLPEIPVDDAIALEITHGEKFVAKRDAPTRAWFFPAVFVGVLIVVGVPWVIGIVRLLRWTISVFGQTP
jgi:hypothetical protein